MYIQRNNNGFFFLYHGIGFYLVYSLRITGNKLQCLLNFYIAELSFQAQFCRKAPKSQEILRNADPRLLDNTVHIFFIYNIYLLCIYVFILPIDYFNYFIDLFSSEILAILLSINSKLNIKSLID